MSRQKLWLLVRQREDDEAEGIFVIVVVVFVVFAAAEIECGNKMQRRVIKFQ